MKHNYVLDAVVNGKYMSGKHLFQRGHVEAESAEDLQGRSW